MSSCEHIPDTNGTNMRPSDHCAKNGLTDRSEKMKLFILILDWTQAENEFKTDLRDLHQRLLKASSWAGFVMSDNPASLYEELSYICDHCQTLENGMQNMEQAWEQGREASEDLMRYHVLHPKICTDSRLATEYQRITAEKFEAKVVGDKKDMEKALSIVKGLFGGEVERLPVGKFQVLLENREQEIEYRNRICEDREYYDAAIRGLKVVSHCMRDIVTRHQGTLFKVPEAKSGI